MGKARTLLASVLLTSALVATAAAQGGPSRTSQPHRRFLTPFPSAERWSRRVRQLIIRALGGPDSWRLDLGPRRIEKSFADTVRTHRFS